MAPGAVAVAMTLCTEIGVGFPVATILSALQSGWAEMRSAATPAASGAAALVPMA